MLQSLRQNITAAMLLALASGLAFTSGRACVSAADGPAIATPVQSLFVARDEFDGRLQLNWKPIREDASHLSLTRHPGQFTIVTQRGAIHGKNNNQPDRLARNLFVIDNPLAANADFQMTTCLVNFTPGNDYQQAGLVCYNDDDNYLKWMDLHNSRSPNGHVARVLAETNAESDATAVELPKASEKLWLRLTRRGNIYEYASSVDGLKFETHGERIWGDLPPKRLGLMAKNGGGRNSEAIPEIDARFEFFELLSPVPAKPAP